MAVVEVEQVPWPGGEERRGELAAAGAPRLLVVAPGASIPEVVDPLEDWIRDPCDPAELAARLTTLSRRSARGRPTVDGDGVLRIGSRSVVLPPIEARLAGELLSRVGTVVTRDALMRAGWPDGTATRNLLDVRVLRLRRRLAGTGLEVRTVRHRGYLLVLSDGQKASDGDA